MVVKTSRGVAFWVVPLDSHVFVQHVFSRVCLTLGEVGNSMFILLNGSADVFVLSSDEESAT